MLPVTMCHIATIFIGANEVKIGSAPFGNCSYCCAITPRTDIKYNLFTRSNPNRAQRLVADDISRLRRSNLSLSDPVVIYLHGFSEASTGIGAKTIRDAYLQRDNYNVILADWAPLVTFPWYVTAVSNTRIMGESLASMTSFLVSSGISAGKIHIVGFSLGAEAAGFAGKRLRNQGITVGRITGLDPAFPGYGLTNSTGHLARGDANFVDIIHTNPGIFGFAIAIGDVDFYPNAGNPIQPGCTPMELFEFQQLDRIYGCSHNRAWRYYAESIGNPQGFPATLCTRWRGLLPPCRFSIDGYMGLSATARNRGKMFLTTNANSPYAKNGP